MSNEKNAGMQKLETRDVATLTITLRSDGSASIAAPLHDKILCYGMLEIGRDLVRDTKPAQVILATPAQVPIPANGG